MESELPLMLNDGQVRLISGVWGEPGFGKVTAGMLEKAKQHLRDKFIVTGLTEQFDASLQLLKERLNWVGDITYRRLNVSRRGVSEQQLSRETVNTVRRANRHDLALYAYARELFVEQCAQQGALFNLRVRRLQTLNRAAPLRAKLGSIR
jgi:hypothetical protein